MNTPNVPEVRISTPDQFKQALRELLARTDMAAIGTVKDHLGEETIPGDRNSRQPTGEVFMTSTLRMPTDVPVIIDGAEFWPNSLQIKIDAFKLAAEPKSERATPRAASAISADALRAKLQSKPLGGAVPNGGKAVVAKPASKV